MVETRKLAAIFAADVVGYSRLADADEERTLARLRALRSDVNVDPTTPPCTRAGWSSAQATAPSSSSAAWSMRCAVRSKCRTRWWATNSGVPEDHRIEFRIGVHLGDVVEESDGDLMGDGVNIGERLEGITTPAQRDLPLGGRLQAGMKSRLDLNVTRSRRHGAEKHSRGGARLLGRGQQALPPRPSRGSRQPRNRLIPAVAALAALIVVAGAAAAAWYLTAGKTVATVASSAPAARSGVPTVAILPFANATGNPQYDPLTQRIGQKTRDAAGNDTIWRIVGSPGGAAAGAADPIEAGRQLNADYVVTGNLEAAGDTLRVTFRADEVHSGARIWSQTISPVLESVHTAAAEAEVAGRAEGLLSAAILDAERRRLSLPRATSTKTTWGCVLEGFAADQEARHHRARARCLEAAAEREPSQPQCVGGACQCHCEPENLGHRACLRLRTRASTSAPISPRTSNCRRPCAPANLAPPDSRAQFFVAGGYYATCQPELAGVLVEAEKAAALNPYDASTLGGLGLWVAFTDPHWDEEMRWPKKAIEVGGAKIGRSILVVAEGEASAWFRGEYQRGL